MELKMPFGWDMRPMRTQDIETVLEIVFDHDEDDGEWAQESYQERGVQDQYVLTHENQVAGVTGFRFAQGTKNAFWLTWTYLAAAHQGQKMGRQMLYRLFEILRKKKARKIFVSLSDYIDPEDGAIYQKAIKLYASVGFKEAIIHRDYYAPGESQMIYGCELSPVLPHRTPKPEKRGIVLTDVFKVDETKAVFAVDWDFEGRSCFGLSEMQAMMQEAAEQGAQSVFVSFPSNVTATNDPLQAAGFVPCGMLEHYFEDGLHEIQYRYDIKP